MGKVVSLTAEDGHTFSAYRSQPSRPARGGLIVVQEIFGVNAHIREVADAFAADGYAVIAPALFDRAEPGVELGYEGSDRDRGVALRQSISFDDMLSDNAASIAAVSDAGRVGIVGYCLGGSLTWLAACRLPGLSAAIGYYGSMVAKSLDETPLCPVMLHFGEEDAGIPMADVERVRAAVDPATVQVFSYPGAGHAFNRHGNRAHHQPSAKLARERTIAFLAQHVG
jgi:carboxymethylenebutenolidase